MNYSRHRVTALVA